MMTERFGVSFRSDLAVLRLKHALFALARELPASVLALAERADGHADETSWASAAGQSS